MGPERGRTTLSTSKGRKHILQLMMMVAWRQWGCDDGGNVGGAMVGSLLVEPTNEGEDSVGM